MEILSGTVDSCQGRWAALQVKGRAKALLDKQPLSQCSAEVQAAADKAQRERRSQGGRKRFASRYGDGWGDANGRTPRAHSTPFHNGGGGSWLSHPMYVKHELLGDRVSPHLSGLLRHFMKGRASQCCVRICCNVWPMHAVRCCACWAVTQVDCCRANSWTRRMGQINAHPSNQWL